MRFGCQLATVDFFPQYSWFLGQLSNWLGKNLIQGLKLGMSNIRSPTWSIKVTLSIGSSRIPVQTQTLISGHQCKEMSWAEQTPIWSWIQRVLWGEILIIWEGKFWGTTVRIARAVTGFSFIQKGNVKNHRKDLSRLFLGFGGRLWKGKVLASFPSVVIYGLLVTC